MTTSGGSGTRRARRSTRPPHLATDAALVIDALRDLIDTLSGRGRDARDHGAARADLPASHRRRTFAPCLTLLVAAHGLRRHVQRSLLNPHRAWRIENDRPDVFIPGAIPWLPRQKLPEAYQLNGAVYAFRIRSPGRRHAFACCSAGWAPSSCPQNDPSISTTNRLRHRRDADSRVEDPDDKDRAQNSSVPQRPHRGRHRRRRLPGNRDERRRWPSSGANVVIASRDGEKCRAAPREVASRVNGTVRTLGLELDLLTTGLPSRHASTRSSRTSSVESTSCQQRVVRQQEQLGDHQRDATGTTTST